MFSEGYTQREDTRKKEKL